MIEIQDVSKKFGKKVAVTDLTLTVRPGELFAFLGPNGAGKTTTIKMLVGLLRPSAGSIKICGHDIGNNHLAAKAQIGYIPDMPYLYEKLSGREFLQFVADMYKLDPATSAARIAELAGTFEMHDYLDDLCESYSHGMRQRVVYAAALLHDPAVLILDEPMVGLDPKSARLVKDLMKAQARKGATLFMSTHTLSVAEEVADRIGIIHRSKLIALGTVDELRALSRTDGRLEDAFLRITEEGASET
ncbi:MAG: ABC transporter ATP-binding protein [Planctomycetes bacterium]|nr:ABC transporter ATP-binding protein [Planctomycetota bacterium]